MATSDSELIQEARSFTGYTGTESFTDSDIQEIVDICKEELYADFTDWQGDFWTGNQNADRALFWFTCIGIKVRAGEIGAADISIDEIETRDSETEYEYWFQQFRKRRARMKSIISGSTVPTRSITRDDDRTYEYSRPQG